MLITFFKKIIENKHKLKEAEILKNKLPSTVIHLLIQSLHVSFPSSYPQLLEACNSHRALARTSLAIQIWMAS